MRIKCNILRFLLIISISATAQKRDHYWLKQGIAAGSLMYAGFLHGTNEVKKHDYRRFAARRTRADPQFHNPKLSFRNKYKNFPSDKSPAYWGSKTVLAWTTDAYHMNATGKNILLAGNIGLAMSLYDKPNWKQILLQAAASWGAYALGTGAAHAYYKEID